MLLFDVDVPEGYTYIEPKMIGTAKRVYDPELKKTVTMYTVGYYENNGNIVQAVQSYKTTGIEM